MNVMFRVGLLACLISAAAAQTRQIALRDKVAGGWAGQTAALSRSALD